MTRSGLALVSLVVATAWLGGCVLGRSKTARTFVLDPVAAREASAPTSVAVAVVGVEKVSVPDWLDRPQVTGRGAGGEVVADELSRWGEPLPRGVQRVVGENLAALLPDRRILTAPYAPRETIEQRVSVTIVDLARHADGAVVLEARWELIAPDGRVLARRRSTHRATELLAGAAGAVAGVNETLAALCREIADVVREMKAPA